MTDRVLVNRTRTALLPPNSPEKGFLILRSEAAKLGLVDSPDKPVQERRTAAAKVGPSTKAPQRRRSTKQK